MTDEYDAHVRAWWGHCTARERTYWRKQAASDAPVDAWRAYRGAITTTQPVARRCDVPCPDCGHRFTEELVFPDGRAVFCRACGYRTLEVTKS